MWSTLGLLAVLPMQLWGAHAFLPSTSSSPAAGKIPPPCKLFHGGCSPSSPSPAVRRTPPCRLFHGGSTLLHAATATSPVEAKVEVKTEVPVTRISVCAGELCQCQGEYEYEGGAADAAIESLQSLDLPFPVDEVGCLGACGMGTMIAIDFDNGDSIMTDGLDSTLAELGIQPTQKTLPPPTSVVEIEETEKGATIEAVGGSGDEASPSAKTVASTVASADTVEKAETPAKKPAKKPPVMADVRDRMRQEAADEEVQNPWMNMALYLAKKAIGSE